MKKSPKNNFSGKKRNQHKKNSDIYSKKTNSSKKNNRFPKDSFKNQEVNNFNESDKNKVNNSYLKRSKPIIRDSGNFSLKSNEIYRDLPNKKNFDDWIWGKHSVFEALTSERAINRIWCTSEIFSSEKFYILLKDLKSKGVLIEEVSWNRLSQLTFGASHQGVALQLACSKTISLEKSINCSRDIVLEHANCNATP